MSLLVGIIQSAIFCILFVRKLRLLNGYLVRCVQRKTHVINQ